MFRVLKEFRALSVPWHAGLGGGVVEIKNAL